MVGRYFALLAVTSGYGGIEYDVAVMLGLVTPYRIHVRACVEGEILYVVTPYRIPSLRRESISFDDDPYHWLPALPCF